MQENYVHTCPDLTPSIKAEEEGPETHHFTFPKQTTSICLEPPGSITHTVLDITVYVSHYHILQILRGPFIFLLENNDP